MADEVFVAADITSFRPERQALYKGLRIENGEVAYMFQPVYLESVIDRTVIQESEDGRQVVSGGGQNLSLIHIS